MSIFKSTLKPVIASQLKAREKVISSDNRNDVFLRYTSGKNSWVRMTSFVNYDSKIFDKKTGKLVNDNKYTGDNLSRKYVLEGGTLYNKGEDLFSLRSGVGKIDGIYASNIDKISQNPSSNKVDRLYGLRPMPGITSVNVINKNAYGSLREATIQFMAWDKHQLEELEILFMRTGYTVLLEWGWSQYIDHETSNGINNYPDINGIKNFDNLTINPFNPSLTDDAIYDRIDKDINKYKGNYDALLGYIKNFSWQLMPNGGFQCSTTLISRGEVIETIKASSNPNILLGSNIENIETPSISDENEKPILSNFEKIFLNIIGYVNEGEFVGNFNYGTQSTLNNIPGSFYITGSTSDDQKILRDQSESIYKEIKERLSKSILPGIAGSWDNYTISNYPGVNLDNYLAVRFCDGKSEGTGIEYISLNAFIAILSEFFLLKNKKNKKPITSILLPGVTPCLASVDSVSIDPTTCIIKNSQAVFITNLTSGFNPELYSPVDIGSLTTSATATLINIPEFLGAKNVGLIGNIYVSISKLIQLYRNLSGGPDGVDVLTLLQDVLDACSFALGGINDFKLYSDKNTVQIIDAKYFENASKESKFKFDLIGLKSICRDVKINSRIFAEQSTMIGIAAGASGRGTDNLGDIYSSTQAYFNRGLKDRVISAVINTDDETSITYGSTTLTKEEAYYVNIFQNIDKLSNYINRNVSGASNLQGSQLWQVTVIPQENEVINAASLLKTVHLQLNGGDIDFKALIPFELEITLDGIGGFIIGQIFTIDKTILPRDYYNKNLGFIILGVNHILQNNDWTTSVRTQICLLDNDSIKDRVSIDKQALKDKIQSARAEQAKNGYLYCALADFMISQYFFVLLEKVNPNEFRINNGLLFDLENDPKRIYNITNNRDTEMPPKIKLVSDYINDRGFVETYLKNWYDLAKPLNAPNFPATYADFITPSGGGASDWNSVITNITNLLRSQDNSSVFNLTDVSRYPSGGGTLPKNSGESDASHLIRLQDGFKKAWEATFFGKIYKDYLLSNGGTFPKIAPTIKNGGSNIINHIPFEQAGGFENLKADYFILTTNYGFNSNSFDSLFVLFYNYLKDNNASLGLSAYGAPFIGTNTSTTTANFTVVHLEKPK